MNNLTQRDTDQIFKHSHDEKLNANRVTIVDGIKIDTSNIEHAITSAFGNLKMLEIKAPAFPSDFYTQKSKDIQVIEVPVIVKEYETIEKPVYISEVRVIEVEKPIIIETVKYIEIEKQIVVKEQLIVEIKIPEIIRQYEKIPIWVKISLAAFLGTSLLTNIILLIRK